MSSSLTHQISLQDVAVIVAAKNEEKNIRDCVTSILNATQGKSEVWVVDDGSTDQTRDILHEFSSSIRMMRGKGEGPSIARNTAMKAIARPYIAFADADCFVEFQWLESLVSELHGKEKTFVSVGGIQKHFPDAGGWELFHAKFLESVGFVSDYVHGKNESREVNHNPTCNVLYDRLAVLSIGGFDESLWPCEDLDLDIRLKKYGYHLLYTPKAVIHHHRADSFMGFMKMMKRYGFGHAHLVKKHGITQKIHILPLITLIGIGAILFVTIYMPWILLGLLGWLVVWMLICVLDYSKYLLKKTMYGFYILPSIISWNLGFWSGLFQKKRITIK